MDGHQDTHFMEMQEECSKNFLEEIILLLVNKSYNKQKFQINLQTVLHNMILLQIQGKDPGGGNAKGAEKKIFKPGLTFQLFCTHENATTYTVPEVGQIQDIPGPSG